MVGGAEEEYGDDVEGGREGVREGGRVRDEVEGQRYLPKVLGQDNRTSADEDLPEWLVGKRRSTVMMWRE